MKQYTIFSILDSVDSTNNYAMGQVHAGLAKHGMAWFANNQTAGKGQRGKTWESAPGTNIILSIVIAPEPQNRVQNFIFNAAVSVACIGFLQSLTGEEFKIKWPNDIYWCDRKAGGILIENVIQGNQWKWSVIGVGINVNQTNFPLKLINPVSLKNITGKKYETLTLAKLLHTSVLNNIEKLNKITPAKTMETYNALLYKKDEEVQLRKNNIVFKTYIKGVDQFGNLLTSDEHDRSFTFGDIEWVF